MNRLRQLRLRAALLRGRSFDEDLAEEMETHLRLEAEANQRAGMTDGEARRAARRKFGNPTLHYELSREVWGWGSLERLGKDVKYALRTMRKAPGFTATAVLTLALGIGANTAIFSVVKAVLLDPLPYAEPGRVVTLAETAPAAPDNPTVDYTAVRELGERSRSLEGISALVDASGLLFETEQPEILRGLRVSHDFFDTLGVKMPMGRNFLPHEDSPGRRSETILSHDLWVRRFGADPNILGRVLRFSVFHVTVVGVLPPDFKPLIKGTSELAPENYYPLGLDAFASCRTCQGVYAIGRLKRGAKLGEARAELNLVLRRMARENPAAHLEGARMSLVPLPDRLLGRAGAALWAVWGAVGLVLLIACANVANLLLARATGREREMALRAALGASRGRVVRQLLTESLMLALMGGAAGILMAFAGTGALASLAPAQIPRAQEAKVDAAVLLFAMAATLAAGLLFGLAPAWRALRVDLNQVIKGADSGAGGHARPGLGGGLVVLELALAFVLVMGAGLMTQTFLRLMRVDPGYDPRNVLTLTTSVWGARYADNRNDYYLPLLERLRATPGIESAALTSLIPMDHTERVRFHREDRPAADETDAPSADIFSVSTDYFRVLRIPLKRGRVFSGQDSASTPRVALISESCARGQFPGEDPVGKHIRLGGRNDGSPWITVVGVVGDVRQDGIDEAADPQVYVAQNQEANRGYYRLVARTTGDPMRMERPVRSVCMAVDDTQPVYHAKPLEAYFTGRLAARTFALALLGLLGALALLLAAVGTYGVMSYSVNLRRREMGIRMALGAGRRDVQGMVLGQAAALAGCGLAAGGTAAFWLTRILSSLLYEVTPTDVATFAAVAVVLAVVTLAAGCLPARRATRIDPSEALRCE